MDSNKAAGGNKAGQSASQAAGKPIISQGNTGKNPMLMALIAGNLVSLLGLLIPIIGNIIGGVVAGYLAKGGMKRGALIGAVSQVIIIIFLVVSLNTEFATLKNLPLNASNGTYNGLGLNATEISYLHTHGADLGSIEGFIIVGSILLLAITGAVGGVVGSYIFKARQH